MYDDRGQWLSHQNEIMVDLPPDGSSAWWGSPLHTSQLLGLAKSQTKS